MDIYGVNIRELSNSLLTKLDVQEYSNLEAQHQKAVSNEIARRDSLKAALRVAVREFVIAACNSYDVNLGLASVHSDVWTEARLICEVWLHRWPHYAESYFCGSFIFWATQGARDEQLTAEQQKFSRDVDFHVTAAEPEMTGAPRQLILDR